MGATNQQHNTSMMATFLAMWRHKMFGLPLLSALVVCIVASANLLPLPGDATPFVWVATVGMAMLNLLHFFVLHYRRIERLRLSENFAIARNAVIPVMGLIALIV